MKPRTALACRALGGLSLALMCVPIGYELTRDATFGATPAEPVAAAPDGSAGPADRVAQPRSRLGDLPSALPLGALCAPSCDMLLASLGESSGAGHARAALVSAPPVEELPPAGSASVAIAFAQAAVQGVESGPTQPSRYEPAQPAMPAKPARPGGLWLQPVITALLEPAEPENTETTDPRQPDAEPQGEGATPAAVPPDAHATPPLFDPSSASPAANPGAPFKRGTQPSEKPGARSASPLPHGPAPSTTGPGRGPAGPGDSPEVPSLPPSDAPNFAPIAAPDNSQPSITPAPDLGRDPVQTPLGPHQPAAPSSLPQLLEPIGPVLERIADPSQGESPGLDAALPSLLLVVAAVPEPTSLTLFAIASFCLAGLRRARRR